jgi:blue light- and temperature-responsive anti-repressor
MDLIQFVYHSRMVIARSGLSRLAEFSLIHKTAVKNNRFNGISGFLVFSKDKFIQVLEGERKLVFETFDRIKRDDRHTDITVLGAAPCQSRAFPDWLMGAMSDDVQIQEAMLGAGIGGNTDITRLNAGQIIKVFSMLADRPKAAAR